MFNKLKSNLKESFNTVLPIIVITFILKIFIPIPNNLLFIFLISSILLVLGTSLFTFGTDLSMELIGEKIGNRLVKTRSIFIILLVSFIIGTVITIAEPDLKVLADQLVSIPNLIMILTISVGVGISLLLSSLRTILGWNLNIILLIGYLMCLVLMFFVPNEFVPVAFDSGGVTTGTISIPFIMTLGLGLTMNRTDKKAQESGFGLVALCSVGPIIAMLILGMFYPTSGSFDISLNTNISYMNYLSSLLISMKDVVLSLAPIFGVFVVYQLITHDISIKEVRKIILGFIIIFIGLSLFFTATSVGFMDMGYYIGENLTVLSKVGLIVFSVIASYFIAIAEPAVQVLNEQVEKATEGKISKKTMNFALASGVSIAVFLSLIRIFTNTSFIYYILIGQSLSLILMFFTPKVFTAIAFDAGGATGGSLTTTFLLPIAIGTCISKDGNILQEYN